MLWKAQAERACELPFWNGYNLTTTRGRERLYVFCSARRPRHVWFSSPCRVFSGASSQRVSRILQGIADVFPRVLQALGRHVHFLTTTQFGQLESEILARHDRKDVEGSRQWLLVGFA